MWFAGKQLEEQSSFGLISSGEKFIKITKKGETMFQDKILKSVAEAVKNVLQQEALKGQQHKIDKNKNNKIDAHDFKILRGEKKGMKKEETEQIDELSKDTLTSYATKAGKSLGGQVANIGNAKQISKFYADKTSAKEVKKDAIHTAGKRMFGLGRAASRLAKEEVNNPFDLKNYKSQLPTKPGEKAGFDSKKISTGTVYSRKPVKDEKPLKEEDAYDKDRYAVKDGKAVKDNPGHMGSANYKDQAHHVWASSAEEALKKKGMKEEASNDEFHAEVKKAKEKSLGKQTADVAKPAVSAVKQESVEQVDEKHMTPGEMKKREKIVKSMKKGMQGFKDRYGERAKEVMYATATARAKGE
jgi:hypothetical protein